MKSLKEFIQEAEKNKIAIGHFNVSDLAGLKAVFEAAKNIQLPIIIGVSEGERDFIGVRQIASLIKSLREEYNFPTPNKSLQDYTGQVFLNADHTHSLKKIKEAVEAGFDAVMFDASQLPLEENVKKTKEAVDYAKNIDPNILVEGEIGYIGGGSTILKEIPKDAAIKTEDLSKPEEAAQFLKETGVDLLAPAVGNIHGIFKNASQPNLNIERIKEIKNAVKVPLVLHGGSGIKDGELTAAIDAGISIVHINTELRLAWRKGIEKAFKENSDEIVPYKLLPIAVEGIKKVAEHKLKVFNKLT
jgi:fructose-bisphosphate aldolase class II